MKQSSQQAPAAKRLILSLLSAPDLGEASIASLEQWGALFDIDAAAIRVTVGRLKRQGLLASPRRGVYVIGPKGRIIADTARDWVNVERRIGYWDGNWILAHCAHLGRGNRTALRARERALRLNGFAEYAAGLWIRPSNLAESLTATQQRLITLGMEADTVISLATEIAGVSAETLFALWPGDAIESAYRHHCDAMTASLARLGKLPLADAARETIQVGEAVIRQINSDPLLPDPIVDAAARSRMIAQMLVYDRAGRDIWQRLIEASGAGPDSR